MFKGELTIDDILNRLTYRQLRGLWDARVSRLKREHEAEMKAAAEAKQKNIRKNILMK